MSAPSSDAARIIPSLHEIAPWNGFITQMSIAPEFETSSVKRRLRVRPLNRMVTPTDPSFMVTGSSIPRPAFRPSITAVRACCLNMAVFMSQGTLTAKRALPFHFPRFSVLVCVLKAAVTALWIVAQRLQVVSSINEHDLL